MLRHGHDSHENFWSETDHLLEQDGRHQHAERPWDGPSSRRRGVVGEDASVEKRLVWTTVPGYAGRKREGDHT